MESNLTPFSLWPKALRALDAKKRRHWFLFLGSPPHPELGGRKNVVDTHL